MPSVGSALQSRGVSAAAAGTVDYSTRKSTKTLYKTYLLKWQKFCNNHGHEPLKPNATVLVNFLQTLLDEPGHRGYSAINTARSAISSLTVADSVGSVGSHPLVKALMAGVHNLRPPRPRYAEIWDPNCVLNFLRRQGPARSMCIKLLVKKLCMLILLATGQRGQIIRALKVGNMTVSKNSYKFKVENSDLKQGRIGYRPNILELKAYPADKRLCVHNYLTRYLERTLDMRGTTQELILTTQKPYKAASRDTISRWMKEVLRNAGIDTTVFGPGSTRSATTSKALAAGASIDEILQAGGWSRASTFQKFYNRPLVKAKSKGLSSYILE